MMTVLSYCGTDDQAASAQLDSGHYMAAVSSKAMRTLEFVYCPCDERTCAPRVETLFEIVGSTGHCGCT